MQCIWMKQLLWRVRVRMSVVLLVLSTQINRVKWFFRMRR